MEGGLDGRVEQDGRVPGGLGPERVFQRKRAEASSWAFGKSWAMDAGAVTR